jgi:hypothetical protein
MASSLCISNEKLTAVCGSATPKRASVKSFASAMIPEGALLNGVITDERLLTLALDELREKLPKNALQDVKIALRTSLIYVKRMVVPALPQKKMLDWVSGAFSGVADNEELYYDYMFLERDSATGGHVALLGAAQKSMIAGLAKYFEAQNMSISSIDTTLSAQIKLMRLLDETRESTFILLVMDGVGMDAALFTGGSFRSNSSVRLFAERGTPESAAEISRQVSSIIQFNAAERSGQRITHVYIAGLRPGEERLFETLKAAYGLEACPLPDESDCVDSPPDSKLPLTEYVNAVGNLIDL